MKCAALWVVSLLIGTDDGLMLLDRLGQGTWARTFYWSIVIDNIEQARPGNSISYLHDF